MKRILTVLMALCLCFSLGVPAWAAVRQDTPDLEDDLTSVATQVKDILAVDDDYTSFSGDYSDGLTPCWYLYWSDDTRDLSVTYRADGVITDVYFWQDDQEYDRFYGFDAAFPAVTEETAKRQAQNLLAKLMATGERARIDSVTTSLSDGSYRFSGTVMVNGLESPITFSMTMDDTGLVSYYRSDSYVGYVGDIPAAQTQVDKTQAGEALAQAVELELYYVTDGDEARLTYVPVGANMVVDAATGSAVDMDELYASVGGSYAEYETADTVAASATMDVGGRGLTEVELASIASYGDVLSQETIDGALRDVPALGLEDFSLQSCSYAMDSTTADVTATLRYTALMTSDQLYGYSQSQFEEFSAWYDDMTVTKYITVDGKSGQLLTVNTSYPLYQKDSAYELSVTERLSTSEAFLSQVAPEMFEDTAVCGLKGYEDGYTFARLVDGYFYPENYLFVALNQATATVDTYYYTWNDDMTFAPAEGLMTEEAALETYVGAMDVTLGYVAWPETVDGSGDYAVYLDWGYTYVESLRLGYYYSGVESVTGVDALTGQVYTQGSEAAGEYAYEDAADIPQAEQITALAQAGIGFAGGIFGSDEALTMRQAVVLLLQAAGYTTPETWDDERLESITQNQGFLSAGQWQPEETITEIEFVRMILGASRYGAAAELTAAWSPVEGVSEPDTGYAAIASALGMLTGDSFAPSETCTHLMAAQLLYGFMNRVK